LSACRRPRSRTLGYDHAAALLTSARALEVASRDPGAVPALAPTLACLDVSLDALAAAVERLRTHALERLADPMLPADDMRAARRDRGGSGPARRNDSTPSPCWVRCAR
jgi:hypothetical protein